VAAADRTQVRTLGAGLLATVGTAAIVGIPTDVISNPWFGRETPVRAFDVVVLVALSVLTGALLATYAVPTTPAAGPRRFAISAGVLGWFAVSCPACNTIVVGLLGASGATSVFAPMQPALGVAAVALALGAGGAAACAQTRQLPAPCGDAASKLRRRFGLS
jgi:hypothetical protein